jgi:hypothetical protein
MATNDILLAQAQTPGISGTDGAVMDGLRAFGSEIGQALPNILGAILILIIGVIVANALSHGVRRLLLWAKVDRFVQSSDTPANNLENLGIKFQAADMAGFLIRWLVIFLAIALAADMLAWTQVTNLMNGLVSYLPNIAAAILLLIGGYALGNFIGNAVANMGKSMPTRTKHMLGNITRYAVIVFASMAALIQLGIAENIILIAFIGLMTAVSLATGLAFGLGGRDKARELLADIKPPSQMPAA